MENKKKPYISPSQISSYLRCGEVWRRRYKKNEIIPPRIVMAKGTALHKGAAHNFAAKLTSHQDLPSSEVLDLSMATFEETIKREGVDLTSEEKIRGKTIVVSEAKKGLASMALLMMKDVAPRYQPTAVEDDRIIELENSSHNLKGIIDLEDDKERIMDLKSSGKPWTQDRADGDGQMTFYAMMKRAKSGQDPKAIIIENIYTTKKETKNVTLETHRSMDDYRAMIARINTVLDGINKEYFPPASDGAWWCSREYCGYWDTCVYVNQKRGIHG